MSWTSKAPQEFPQARSNWGFLPNTVRRYPPLASGAAALEYSTSTSASSKAAVTLCVQPPGWSAVRVAVPENGGELRLNVLRNVVQSAVLRVVGVLPGVSDSDIIPIVWPLPVTPSPNRGVQS
jgi:hypothetical protein